MLKQEAFKRFMEEEASDWAIDHRMSLLKKAFDAGYKYGMEWK